MTCRETTLKAGSGFSDLPSLLHRFSAPALDPQNNMDPRATYKYVDIVEIPTDEIINDEDNITAIVNDANWPQPIPVNGPNSNLNTGGLLSTITNKWLEDKMSAYTKDFGTFIGRFRPRAHGIAGLVSETFISPFDLFPAKGQDYKCQKFGTLLIFPPSHAS